MTQDLVKNDANFLGDDRYRSRKFLLATFVEAFASLVVVAVCAAHLAVFVFGFTATAPPLMPVLWWWLSTSSGVLSLYGLSTVGEILAGGRKE
jgi:hypothetical protein